MSCVRTCNTAAFQVEPLALPPHTFFFFLKVHIPLKKTVSGQLSKIPVVELIQWLLAAQASHKASYCRRQNNF